LLVIINDFRKNLQNKMNDSRGDDTNTEPMILPPEDTCICGDIPMLDTLIEEAENQPRKASISLEIYPVTRWV
jgi:hypothetical protein